MAHYSYLCPKLKLINIKKKREERKKEEKGRDLTYKGIIWATFCRSLLPVVCRKMLQAKFPSSVFGTEVAVSGSEISLVSSLLHCDTSADSLHTKKIERRLIPISSAYAKFGVIPWSFEWARADLTTEIRLRRIMPTSRTDRGRVICLANSPSPRAFYKRMGFDQAEHDLCSARDHGAWSRLSSARISFARREVSVGSKN